MLLEVSPTVEGLGAVTAAELAPLPLALVRLVVACQAGSVAETPATLLTGVPSPSFLLGGSGCGASLPRGLSALAAPVLLAEGVKVGFVPGAELQADLQIGGGLSQVLLAWCVVVQELFHVGDLVL